MLHLIAASAGTIPPSTSGSDITPASGDANCGEPPLLHGFQNASVPPEFTVIVWTVLPMMLLPFSNDN